MYKYYDEIIRITETSKQQRRKTKLNENAMSYFVRGSPRFKIGPGYQSILPK
jgi:hypothetical protein